MRLNAFRFFSAGIYLSAAFFFASCPNPAIPENLLSEKPVIRAKTPTALDPAWKWQFVEEAESYQIKLESEDTWKTISSIKRTSDTGGTYPEGVSFLEDTDEFQYTYTGENPLDGDTYRLELQVLFPGDKKSPIARKTVTMDFSPPGPPVSDTTGSITTGDTTPEWTWSGGSDVHLFIVQLDGGRETKVEPVFEAGSQICSASYTPNEPLSHGEHTLSIRSQDFAGNSSTAMSITIHVDTSISTVPVLNTENTTENPTKNQTPTWAWDIPADTSFLRYKIVYQTESAVEKPWLPESGYTFSGATAPYTYTPETPLPYGNYTMIIAIAGTDEIYSEERSHTISISLDQLPAPLVRVSPYDTGENTIGTSVPATHMSELQNETRQESAVFDDMDYWLYNMEEQTFVWEMPTKESADNASGYRYQFDDTNSDLWTEVNPNTTEISSQLDEGAHTLYVQAKNADGMWSKTGSFTVKIDTTPPELTGYTPENTRTRPFTIPDPGGSPLVNLRFSERVKAIDEAEPGIAARNADTNAITPHLFSAIIDNPDNSDPPAFPAGYSAIQISAQENNWPDGLYFNMALNNGNIRDEAGNPLKQTEKSLKTYYYHTAFRLYDNNPEDIVTIDSDWKTLLTATAPSDSICYGHQLYTIEMPLDTNNNPVVNSLDNEPPDLSELVNLIFIKIIGLDIASNDGLETFIQHNVMEKIQMLTLTGCSITDISFLEGLDQLSFCNLSDNQISSLDIDPNTAGTYLPSLKAFYIANNNISNYSLLSEIPSIEILDIDENQTSIDTGQLSSTNLPSIKELYGRNNTYSPSDITAIPNTLTYLDLSNSNITSINPTGSFDSLETLILSGNDFTGSTLTPVSSFLTLASALIKLELNSCGIGNYSALPVMSDLTHLFFENNTYTTVSEYYFTSDKVPAIEILSFDSGNTWATTPDNINTLAFNIIDDYNTENNGRDQAPVIILPDGSEYAGN